MKKKLLILLAVMALTACHINAPDPVGEKKGNFFGTVTVDNDDENFVKENVEASLTLDEETGAYSIKLFRVKFATAMPVEIDMIISDVNVDETGVISADSVVPYAMGGPFEKYLIRDLKGSLTDQTMSFSMICGKYPTSYQGVRREEE